MEDSRCGLKAEMGESTKVLDLKEAEIQDTQISSSPPRQLLFWHAKSGPLGNMFNFSIAFVLKLLIYNYYRLL